MIYAIKSTHAETRQSDMINHFMQVFNKLDIGLLKMSPDGIKAIEAKLKRRIKDSDELFQFELPYLLTNNLCEEILNLRYKQSGNDTKVDTISKRIPKDKFSALMYGLYWIYLEERKNAKVKNNTSAADFCFISKPKQIQI